MQYPNYLRQFVSILSLFGLIFLGGAACLKKIEKQYWPDSSASASVAPKVGNNPPKTAHTDKDAPVDRIEKDDGRLVENDVEVVPDHLLVPYNDQLLSVLQDSSDFTQQEKQAIRNVILANPDGTAILENVCYTVIEALWMIQQEIERAHNETWGQQATESMREVQRMLQPHEAAVLELANEPVQQATQEWSQDTAIVSENECPICFEELKDNCRALPCSPTHCFHDQCIKNSIAAEYSLQLHDARRHGNDAPVLKSTCPMPAEKRLIQGS